MSAPTTQAAPAAQNGNQPPPLPAPGASPALNARSPLLTSSPYLRSMALLDNMDLQQLMAGGDLNQEEAARRGFFSDAAPCVLSTMGSATVALSSRDGRDSDACHDGVEDCASGTRSFGRLGEAAGEPCSGRAGNRSIV